MRTNQFTYIFIFLILYQYIMSMIFLNHTAFYTIINPYTLFSISFLLIIGFFFKNKLVNLKLLIIILLFIIIFFLGFFKYFEYSIFPMNLIKSVQYFYGVVFVVFGIYFILYRNRKRIDTFLLYKQVIKLILIFSSIITIVEFLYINILHLPWEYLGNIPSIGNEYNPNRLITMRPFGIASYPQPNGVILSFLIYLYYLIYERIDKIFLIGFVALFLSMTGTGILVFLLLIPLFFKNTLKVSIVFFILLIILSFFLLRISLLFPDFFIFKRLSIEQFSLYYDIFIQATFTKYIQNFDTYEILLGSNIPNFNIGTGITHDWGYFDVFYEYGIIGLIIYVLIYTIIIYNMIFIFTKKNKKIYFTFIILISNLHYPTINFYVGQFILGILFTINIFNRKYISRI